MFSFSQPFGPRTTLEWLKSPLPTRFFLVPLFAKNSSSAIEREEREMYSTPQFISRRKAFNA